MSLNLEGFLADVKRAALEAVIAAKPFSLNYGTVISTSPLQISVDQKLTLQAEQLILTNAVRDYTVYMTVDHNIGSALDNIDISHSHTYSGKTENPDMRDFLHTHNYSGTTEKAEIKGLSHTHEYKGKKKFTVHLALNTGEKVLLLRADGGQQYIVLDRVEVPV